MMQALFSCGKNARIVGKCLYSSWIPSIGLEVHAQLLTRTKLFTPASTARNCLPNSNVDPFDASIPGTLPVLNAQALVLAVKAALALNCTVPPETSFVRKHYFYPDMPLGYQITQKEQPIGSNGWVDYGVFEVNVHEKAYCKKSKVLRVQLEQDTGSSLHDVNNNVTLVDLNRAGMPLIEIVFDSDVTSGEEASALVRDLIVILRDNFVSSANLFEGAMRVDANVSIRRNVSDPLGVRTEIKNLNSLRSVCQAINYEISRQSDVLESGQPIEPETRTFDVKKQETVLLRKKETDYDYRFLPEGNLPSLTIKDSDSAITHPGDEYAVLDVADLRKQIAPSPTEKREELMTRFGLRLENAISIVHDQEKLALFIEIQTKKMTRDANLTSDLLLFEMEEVISATKRNLKSLAILPENIGHIVDLVQEGRISLTLAFDLLVMISGHPDPHYHNADPRQLVAEKGWTFISGEENLRPICHEILSKNAKRAKGLIKGKKFDSQLFLDLVLKATNRQVNKSEVKQVLMKVAKELHPDVQSEGEHGDANT